MLKIVPKSWLSWDFHVTEDGRELTFIDRHWFRERASFELDGGTYDVRRTSVMRSTFVLEHDGAIVAEATKPSSFRRTFEITTGAEHFTLEAVSMMTREMRLRRGNVPMGTIRPDGLLRRNASAQFTTFVPKEVQLFVVFLVLVLWKRASDSAAAGS